MEIVGYSNFKCLDYQSTLPCPAGGMPSYPTSGKRKAIGHYGIRSACNGVSVRVGNFVSDLNHGVKQVVIMAVSYLDTSHAYWYPGAIQRLL